MPFDLMLIPPYVPSGTLGFYSDRGAPIPSVIPSILQTRADIYKEKGGSAAARKTIEQAVELAESLPEGQRSERTIAALKKKLESM
jgi:hypothetical protein